MMARYLIPVVLWLLSYSLTQSAPVPPSAEPETAATGELTATGDRMELTSEDNQRRFMLIGNVVVTDRDLEVSCDEAEVIIDRPTVSDEEPSEPEDARDNPGRISHITAKGNVVIRQKGTRAFAGRAEIFPKEKKLVLEDHPRIEDEKGTVTGFRIVFLQGERRIRIESDPAGKRSRVTLKDIAQVGALFGDNPTGSVDSGAEPEAQTESIEEK